MICLNFSLPWYLYSLSIGPVHSYRSFMLLYSPLAKSPAYEVKRNRIDAAVDEAQAEAEDPEDVPEIVVVLLGRWAKVEP